jgi:predicted GIY-YIG superfamily endonuclease
VVFRFLKGLFYQYGVFLFSVRLQKYYVGQRKDLENRLTDYNKGETSFMQTGIPCELVWNVNVSSRIEALFRCRKRLKVEVQNVPIRFLAR